MKKIICSCLLLAAVLTGCVSEIIRKNDDRYLQPGALDPILTGYYDAYRFNFLGKYQITHQWPLPARACKYRSLPTLGRDKDRYKGEIFAVEDIYEIDGSTWHPQPPWNFDRFVRPTYKVQIPEFDVAGKKTGRMLEKEETGLEPVCFEAWVGTSHTLILRLHKRDLATWKGMWSEYNPSGKWAQKQVNGIHWWALENEEKDLQLTGTGGWFQSWLAPIGNTGYTLTIQLGANKQSLQHPQAHANFQAMFRHLIESVKIEEIKP